MVLNFSPSPDLLTCATKTFMPNEAHVTRSYNKSVLIIMLDGTLEFMEDGKKITLTRGEYYIQRQGLLQEGIPLKDPPKYFYIEFNGHFSENGNGLPIRERVLPEKLEELTATLEDLFKTHKANPFLLNSYMFRIFSELLEHTPAFDKKANTAWLIKNLIRSRYYSQIKTADIAKQFGYAEDYIIRIFKDVHKITPHQYLINVRMENARWLLENTDKTAEEIAISVGYNDFSTFFRAFKRKYGYAPSIARTK